MQNTAQIIDRAKREVLEDVREGVVPAAISRAFELHDFVDANEYGGLCEDNFGDDSDTNVDNANAVFAALDQWITSGGMRAALAGA